MPPPRRPAAGEANRGDVHGGRTPGERRARDARVHGHLPRPTRVRSGERHGLPFGRDRGRGARPARRPAYRARRHVRRSPARSRAGRPHHRHLGDSGRPDRAAVHRRRAARPDRELGARARRRPCGEGPRQEASGSARSSRATSSTTPTTGAAQRWSERGILGVEMEAAVLFTLGAAAQDRDRLPADRQRHLHRGRVPPDLGRGDAPRRRRHDRSSPWSRSPRNGTERAAARLLVNPASANGSTGRRWPEIAHLAAEAGLVGETRCLGARRADPGARRARRGATEPSSSSPSAATEPSTRRQRPHAARARRSERRARGPPEGHRDGLRPHVRHPDAGSRRRSRSSPPARPGRSTPAGSPTAAWDGSRRRGLVRERCQRGHERRRRPARELVTSKAMGGKASFLWATLAVFARWKASEMQLEVDGERRSGLLYDVLVANCRYLAGGMKMTPEAEPDDGLFDVLVIGDITRTDLALNLSRCIGERTFRTRSWSCCAARPFASTLRRRCRSSSTASSRDDSGAVRRRARRHPPARPGSGRVGSAAWTSSSSSTSPASRPARTRTSCATRGVDLHRVELDEGEPLPDWRDFDAIVAMGGPMSVNDDDRAPWLADEKRAIGEAVRSRNARTGAPASASSSSRRASAHVSTRARARGRPPAGHADRRGARRPGLRWAPARAPHASVARRHVRPPGGRRPPRRLARLSEPGVPLRRSAPTASSSTWRSRPRWRASGPTCRRTRSTSSACSGPGSLPALIGELERRRTRCSQHGRRLFERWLDLISEEA